MTYDLHGKTAVVTGASRGLGEAIARTLAADGARVALVARSLEALTAVAKTLPNGAVVVEADLSSADGWKTAAEGVLKALGDVDILVNNAGASTPQTLENATAAALDATFNVNVRSLILLTQALSASLVRRRGCVVNVSSVAAFSGGPGQIAYASSKGAVNSFTRTAASDLGKSGVRVNAVAPGVIDDGLMKAVFARGADRAQLVERLRPRLPLEGRWGSAQNVADAVAWLVSDKASYVTGQVLRVDGGMTI